ncbi:hypothetical protein JCM11251_005507 [Rhodosporidiobolus azoricus]
MFASTARSLIRRQCTRTLSTTPVPRTHPTNPLDPSAHPHPTSTPPPNTAAGPTNAGAGPSTGPSGTTHFGFRDVPEQMKESLVKGVFSSVASSYDVMNDAMSLGIHRLWKDHYVSKLDPGSHGKPLNCLDVAGGTGDIAMRILDHARTRYGDRETKVTMLDINPEMLAEGKKRFAQTMYHATPQVDFMLGNAEYLDGIPDNSMDLYTIAFGLRNVTHMDKAIEQAYRVLKPGGVFSVLEFNKVHNPILAKAYDLWSFNVIPPMGHLLASDADSYAYLVQSIRKMPSQAKLAQMIRDAGFTVPAEEEWEDLTFGVAAIHTGVKV